jgi:hypothetical protein
MESNMTAKSTADIFMQMRSFGDSLADDPGLNSAIAYIDGVYKYAGSAATKVKIADLAELIHEQCADDLEFTAVVLTLGEVIREEMEAQLCQMITEKGKAS